MSELTIIGTKTDMIRMFQSLLVLNDECAVIVRKDGLECKVVDPAHVSMVQIFIHKTYFIAYKVPKKLKVGDEFKFGLDIESFIQSMSMTTIDHSDEAMAVFNTDSNDGKLVMHSEGLTFDRPFNLADVTGMPDPKIPSLILPFTFELKSQKKLRQIIRDIGTFSDHFKIRRNPDMGNKLFIEWYDGADNLCSFTLTDKLAQTLECTDKNETIKSLYPVEYFDVILRGLSKTFFGDVAVRCSMGSDYPIKITAGKKPLEVNYLLAPRIESD